MGGVSLLAWALVLGFMTRATYEQGFPTTADLRESGSPQGRQTDALLLECALSGHGPRGGGLGVHLLMSQGKAQALFGMSLWS